MGSVNLVVIVESARDLLNHGKTLSLHIPSIVAVGVALGRAASAPSIRFVCTNHPTRRSQVSSLSLLLLVTYQVGPD